MVSSSLVPSRPLAAPSAPCRIQRCSCGHSAQHISSPARRELQPSPAAALPERLSAALADASSASASCLADLASTSPATPYVPSPYTPGPEIWLGALLPTLVFALGSYEFGKRILIQRRCAVCAGTGLVNVPFNNSRSSSPPSSSSTSSSSPPPPQQQQQQFRKVKCRACGGFFPWESAQKFFSAATRPGNGGPLQQPQFPKQTSVLYRVPSAAEAQRAAEEMRERKKMDAAGVAEEGEEAE